MNQSSARCDGWSFSLMDDHWAATNEPLDPELITQAFEDDDFWLPLSTECGAFQPSCSNQRPIRTSSPLPMLPRNEAWMGYSACPQLARVQMPSLSIPPCSMRDSVSPRAGMARLMPLDDYEPHGCDVATSSSMPGQSTMFASLNEGGQLTKQLGHASQNHQGLKLNEGWQLTKHVGPPSQNHQGLMLQAPVTRPSLQSAQGSWTWPGDSRLKEQLWNGSQRHGPTLSESFHASVPMKPYSQEWWATMQQVTPPPALALYGGGCTGAAPTSHSAESQQQDFRCSSNCLPASIPEGQHKAIVIEALEAACKPVLSKRKKKSHARASTPVKPLTAYNFFFRYERERLLKYCAENPTISELELLQLDDLPPEYNEHYHWTVENSGDFQASFLQDHWSRGATSKRPHRKSHGRIAFTSLTKYIARSWNERLPETTKNVFRAMAEHDTCRWRRDMARRLQREQTTA
jgi:hypothetical protein